MTGPQSQGYTGSQPVDPGYISAPRRRACLPGRGELVAVSAGLDWPRLVPIDAVNQRLAEKPPLHASFFRTIEKWE